MVFFLKEELKWNHLMAFICILAAVFFIFYKNKMSSSAQKQNINIQKTALIIGIVLMIIKFIAFFITGSNAILALML